MRRRTTTRVVVEQERGVFMISVAAELAEMHPQTLRMYETRGLIEPKRSPKGTRLYSQADVERLRRIQAMTSELGLNLAGVERVLELEEQLERATRRLEALERRSAEMRAEMEAEIERVRKSFKAELVPYKATTDLIRADDARPGVRSIRVERESYPPLLPALPLWSRRRAAQNSITEGKRTGAARPWAVFLGGG
jgi:MerR family transcriptional regulator/heat shock protein HspR